MKNLRLSTFLLLLLFSLHFSESRLQICKPSGKVKGKNPPPDRCNEDDDDDDDDSVCCIKGRYYTTYKCSPHVSENTKAILNLKGFEKGGDGYMPSRCDNKYHSDNMWVVSLSTGWYNGGRRCLNNITITANGRQVNAMAVDECDSSMGCDEDHDYLPPCGNNVVGASKAVWKALEVPLEDWGELDITWCDA
ncbi:hypothetical protein CDL12_04452 [Handroanthus impetiginosus]|uniref:RlpA-like protein double-psi beta-barrel domain-containing protein n=1 Tax=Handroanthus impetiginosus TaxID=429701 RepID=A0A2G9HZC3_9LAMI|nr:hypothetical protein CDL12_04452 [Handroanthus impetiginosus]